MATIDDEVVALGLAGDRLGDRLVEQFVALRGAQRRAQVGGIFLAEAHVERARAGDAHAIAGFAEIVGHRGDEAEPAAGFLDADIARRSAGALVELVEGEPFGKPRPDHRERQILREPVVANVAERHHLDQGEVHATAMGPVDQRRDFVLVDALERHRIDLDAQAGGFRGRDAVEHLVELAPAGDRAELVGVERIERDVDPLPPMRGELLRIFRQLRAVGGERELVERAGAEMARQRGHQRHDAFAHQGFTAGQPQLAHAFGDERAAQPVELLEREQVLLGQERHVLGHAIHAAEIAAVGHRHAQIADPAAERVGQRARRHGSGAFELHCVTLLHLALERLFVVPGRARHHSTGNPSRTQSQPAAQD